MSLCLNVSLILPRPNSRWNDSLGAIPRFFFSFQLAGFQLVSFRQRVESRVRVVRGRKIVNFSLGNKSIDSRKEKWKFTRVLFRRTISEFLKWIESLVENRTGTQEQENNIKCGHYKNIDMWEKYVYFCLSFPLMKKHPWNKKTEND